MDGLVDITLGVLAILVGAFLCLRGRLLLRLVIPVWGAFTGFAFGAGLVAGTGDEQFLHTLLGWMSAVFFALVFAALAYLYYAVGVVLAMASIGFTLGAGVIVALGIDWSWVGVSVGVVCGVVVGLITVVLDVPMLLLTVVSSVAGALVTVGGLMLLTGAVDSADFTASSFTTRVDDRWWWWVALVVLTLAGIVAQGRDAAAMRRTMRQGWSAPEPYPR
jgi:hypothetical protein